MKSLIGVECVECRRAGHHCQAQMWDGKKPVCLRCADGEPCYRVTAESLPSPERFRDRAVDASFVLEEPPRPSRSRKVEYVMPTIGTYERKVIRQELHADSRENVARAHGLEPWMIDFVQMDGGRPFRPRARVSGGQYANMLPRRNGRSSLVTFIQDATAQLFSLQRETLIKARRSGTELKARQIAMMLMRECGKSLPEIGVEFGGFNHTTVMYSIHKAKKMCLQDRDLQKNIESIKSAVDAEFRV